MKFFRVESLKFLPPLHEIYLATESYKKKGIQQWGCLCVTEECPQAACLALLCSIQWLQA